ncbi:MAG TPA: GntR family transcriptional regulator, partial [Microscillaceae bacterium]|nr:GntR family transcriptional regulator [Microscillaceae bacterium]
DVRLQRDGFEQVDDASGKILKALQENKGYLALSDKSDPEQIKAKLQMSKKVFKKAIGGLYKERKIVIEAGGIRLA